MNTAGRLCYSCCIFDIYDPNIQQRGAAVDTARPTGDVFHTFSHGRLQPQHTRPGIAGQTRLFRNRRPGGCGFEKPMKAESWFCGL